MGVKVGPHLYGRDAELTAVAAPLGASVAGEGRCLVIEGHGGIGKSALLAALGALAREHGARVLTARGAELEHEFPFGVVRQLFEAPVVEADDATRDRWLGGAAALARALFEPTAPADAPPDAGYARLHGLYWLAANLAADVPLVLSVDDAHWGDDASLAFVGFLARRLAHLPLLLVVAARPVPRPPALAALLSDAACEILRPEPLTDEAVEEWLEAAIEQPVAPRLAAACREVTAGNPLLLKELVRELSAGGADPAGEPEAIRRMGPRRVSAAILPRLSALGPDAIAVARAVAVLGDGARLHDAAALGGVPVDRARAAAVGLAAQDILADDDRLAFVHPIVRAAVYEDIAALERADRHLAAARLLHDRQAAAEEIAAHLLAGEPPAEPWVLDTLRLASARASELGDPAAAAALLTRAVALCDDGEERVSLLVALAMAQAQAGSHEAVPRLEQAIADAPSPASRAQAAIVLASLLKMTGQGLRAVEVLDAALAGGPPGPLSDRMEVELVGAGFINLTAARAAGDRIDRLRDPGGRPRDDLERLTIAALGWNELVEPHGRAAVAGELASRALSGTASSDPILGGQAFVVAVVTLIMADRLAEARALLDHGLAEARRMGSAIAVASSASLRALARYRAGDVAGAEVDALEALELGAEVHGSSTMAHPGLAAATWAALERDEDVEEALALDARFRVRLDADVMPYSLVLNARAEVLIADGRGAEALELLRQCDRPERWWGRDCPSLCPWRSNSALALRLLGETDEARRMAADELALARELGAPRSLAVALRAAALTGPSEERPRLLREALAGLEGSPAALERARVLLDLGAELRRAGERRAAREQLERALEIAVGLGALRVARLAREELEASGARLARDRLGGLESLTPSERRVTGAAAEGLTNRAIAQALFLSEKTVETHLSSAYRKLGVRSRRELPAALARAPSS